METATNSRHWRAPLALLLLRLSLGYFLIVWGINKFLAPGQTVAIWGYFYDIEIDKLLPILMGAGETAVALAIILGLWRQFSYAIGFLIHGTTVVIIMERLIMPFVINDGFPVNRNYAVALPVLLGFAVIFLLREQDRWSLDVWWAQRRTKAQRIH